MLGISIDRLKTYFNNLHTWIALISIKNCVRRISEETRKTTVAAVFLVLIYFLVFTLVFFSFLHYLEKAFLEKTREPK